MLLMPPSGGGVVDCARALFNRCSRNREITFMMTSQLPAEIKQGAADDVTHARSLNLLAAVMSEH